MNKIFGILIIIILIASCTENINNTQIQKSSPKIELAKSISTLIDSLYEVDQEIQLKINQAGKSGINFKSKEMKNLYLQEMDIFKRHIPILKNICKKIGYPTIELVGKESSSNFFTLVQHADSDVKFQQEMLVQISKEVKNGNVSGKNYAYLTDRVQLAQGKPQIYGTQLEFNTEIGEVNPKKLLDQENVNQKRKEIGLEPIEIYLNKALEMHFLMNKTHYDKIGIKEPVLYKTE